jgi:O-antigen/teichoic acid export membrane protein
LLAAGPRVLGTSAFSGLAVVWTVANVFGFGVAAPTEQVLNRRLNVGAPHPIRRPMTWLIGAGAVVIAVASALGARSTAAMDFPELVPAIALAIVSWVAVVYVRGRLAGAGDLTSYAIVLVVESASRIVLIAVAVADREAAPVVLAAAVGLPILLAAATGAMVRVPAPTLSAASAVALASEPEPVHSGSEQLAFIVIALSLQLCLNAPPLLLEWRSGAAHPALVGAFVSASSYFRVPTVLVGGVATHALVDLSHAWGSDDFTDFRRHVRLAMRRTILISLSTVGLLAVAAPVLLPALYGSALGLPLQILVALGVSSAFAVVAVVVVQPLLAAGNSREAALPWVVGTILTLGCFALSSGNNALASFGLVIGPVVAVVGATLAVWKLIGDRARPVLP